MLEQIKPDKQLWAMNRCLETLHALRSHKCPSIVINMEQRNLYSIGNCRTTVWFRIFHLGKLLKTYTFINVTEYLRKVPNLSHLSTARKCWNRHSNYSWIKKLNRVSWKSADTWPLNNKTQLTCPKHERKLYKF